MTVPAQAQEASNQPAPQPQKPKGNQLEGKRSDAVSINQAADIFKGSMIGEIVKDDTSKDKDQKSQSNTKQKPEAKPKGQSNPAAAPEESDTKEAEGQSDEETDDNSDSDGEVDEGEGDDGSYADDAEDDQDLHTVVVDGQETQITYDELVSGYLRTADYTKKTMDIAAERKALAAEKDQIADLPKVKEAYQKEAGRFSQYSDLVLVALEQRFMPQPPPDALRQSDPAAYIAAKELHQEALQFMHGLKIENAKIRQQHEAEHQKAVTDGRTKLLQVQPELQKPEIRGQLQQYIANLGYTEDQMRAEADHRLFELAFKAMKYDDMVARAKTVAPDKRRPKVLTQNKARDDKDTISNKKVSEVQNRHKRDHSVKSASAVFEQRILQSRNQR